MVRKLSILFLITILFTSQLSAEKLPEPTPDWYDTQKPFNRLTQEQEKLLMKEVEKVSPLLADRLNRLKNGRPRIYGMVMRRLSIAYRWYTRLKKDPEGKKFADKLWRLSIKERELAVRYREAKDREARREIEKKIRKLDEELFELRQKAREIAIKHLEDKLKQIKKELKEREKHKDEIIRQHVDQLLGKGRGWRW